MTLFSDLRIGLAIIIAGLAIAWVMSPAPARATEPQFEAYAGPALSFLRGARADCSGDVRRVCPGIFPGGGRIAQCLLENQDALSQACAQRMDTVRTAQQAFLRCEPDVKRFCAGVVPGRGRVVSCLAGNRDRLSETCRDGLEDARAALAR